MGRHRRLKIASAVLAVVASLAGCGGNGKLVASFTLDLRLDEFRIAPQDVRMHAGTIKIVAHDDGVLTHNVKVEFANRNDPEGNPIQIGGTPTAHPGQTVTGTVTLQPGRYRLVCTIANHEDLGQYGTLLVER
ncbi:MAG TPA: hypothetical protein VIL64_02945 [Solirubrobacteraceae bacterium]